MPIYSVSRRRAVALLALTSILLITLDQQGNGVVGGARNVFGWIFHPVEEATRVVARPIENAWRGMTNYGELEDENQRLQDQLDQQEGAFIAALAIVRDAQELLALNGIDNLVDVSSVTAQVIGGSPSNFSQTVEINQGSDRGLQVGMPVVNAAGLVGKITQVYANRSVVLLASDVQYAIPVQIVNQAEDTTTTTTTTTTTSTSTTTTTSTTLAPTTTAGSAGGATSGATTTTPRPGGTVTPTATTSTLAPTTTQPAIDLSGIDFGALTPSSVAVSTIAPGATSEAPTTTIDINNLPTVETGIFRGRGSDKAPVVEFVDQNARFGEVRVGALVITSGGSSSLAPRGIVVGRVIKIVERTGTAGAVLEVRLTARLSTLNFVRVLLYQPVVSGQ
ncbi:MAG: rod shape-determining protein MreC [Acidimicrobiia bacterium]|nr:rod shape-determining protein MreC [Actinomycetota bacterium]NDF31254.1 rod shape-determining protein MreC [Acidimicrobiia bacterium]